MRKSGWLVCALAVMVLAVPAWAITFDFDWRDIGGQDFTTPVRNQGACGSCWAFAAVGALEAKFDITASNPNLNYDLSEQHLICDGSCGDCGGGWEFAALDFFRNTGITDEATLPYTAQNTSPNWPLTGAHWLYQITANQNWLTCTTDNLQSALQTYGPLVCAINTSDWYTPTTAPVGDIDAPPLGFMEDPVGAINHAVLMVGYNDVPTLPSGGYWVVKNSWGSGWGDSGYGYFEYGDIEKWNRVHAITGDTYRVYQEPQGYIPEPCTLVLLGAGLVGVVIRRKRRK